MVVVAYGLAAAARVARLAAARLHQLACVAAAALARCGADPTRGARRRRHDGHQRHADGCRPRHRRRASSRARRRSVRTRRPAQLHDRLAALAADALVAALPSAARGDVACAVPQRVELATVAPKIAKAEALLDWRETGRAARAASAGVQSVARRRGAPARRPAAARSSSASAVAGAPAAPPGRDRGREPRAASTSRRAPACCACGAFNRHPGVRWTSRPISQRTRSPGAAFVVVSRLAAGAEVRAVAAQLSRACSRSASPRTSVLPAAGVAPRDRSLLAALVFGALRWHHRLEWQAAQLLTKPLEAASRARWPRCCASGCCSCRSCAFRSMPRCRRPSTRRRCSALRSAGGLVNAVLRRFQREREQLERAASQASRGAIQLTHAG